jgi:hypothetical protein
MHLECHILTYYRTMLSLTVSQGLSKIVTIWYYARTRPVLYATGRTSRVFCLLGQAMLCVYTPRDICPVVLLLRQAMSCDNRPRKSVPVLLLTMPGHVLWYTPQDVFSCVTFNYARPCPVIYAPGRPFLYYCYYARPCPVIYARPIVLWYTPRNVFSCATCVTVNYARPCPVIYAPGCIFLCYC